MDRVGHVTRAIEILDVATSSPARRATPTTHALACPVSACSVRAARRWSRPWDAFMQEADVRYEVDRVTVARMPLAGGLSADEVRDFLMVGTRTGKLASSALSGQPHVASIWFMVDDGGRGARIGLHHREGVGDGSGPGATPTRLAARRRPAAIVRVRQADRHRDDQRGPRRGRPVGAAHRRSLMGADRGDEFVRRNGVPGERLVRLRPSRLSPSAASPTDAAIAGQAGTAAAKN
jgi:hypothetical protein